MEYQYPGVDHLLPAIESDLPAQRDSAFRQGLVYTQTTCQGDYACLRDACQDWVVVLESRFRLSTAVLVCHEMARLAREYQAPKDEANAYRNLSRFYDALGYQGLAASFLERALGLYRKLGDQSGMLYAQVTQLERSLGHRNLEDILVGMNQLMEEAQAVGDTHNVDLIHLRLIEPSLHVGDYDAAAAHIEAIETLLDRDPALAQDWGIAIQAAIGWAEIAVHEGKLDEAERQYLIGLDSAQAQSSRWLEIFVLHQLGGLKTKQQQYAAAMAYLNQAQAKAEKLQLHDLLVDICSLKALIAEAQKNYAQALAFTRQQHAHTAHLAQRKADFDVEKYFLALEKEQLAVERQNNMLELQLRNFQLRQAISITGLSVMLLAVLAIAFVRQRRRKRELAEKHAFIQEQAQRLRNVDAAKSRFFANVSHEFRTPLSLIRGPLSSLLEQENLPTKQTQLLRLSQSAVSHLEQLVNEVLDLGKLEMGKMELHLQPTSLHAYFTDMLHPFKALAEHRHLQFTYQLALDPTWVAPLDQGKCRKVLHNLLSNAFKFTPMGQQVSVYVKRVADNLHVMVEDTGRGIYPEDVPQVFDRYFQTNRPDEPAEGGTGIGLALCQEFVHLMGGDIQVSSQRGHGSRFSASWPVKITTSLAPVPLPVPSAHPPSRSAAQPQPVKAEGKGSTRPLILVVEDNDPLRNYLQLILRETYEVVTAPHGQAAYDYLTQGGTCDLVLSDLMMPVMNGFELVKSIKSNPATCTLPVIMLTARADQSERIQALRTGIDDYLLKPFDEVELRVRIANLLRNQATRQQAQAQFQQAEETTDKFNPALPEVDHLWLEQFETYVRKHLSDPALSVASLAQEFSMSESSLLRQLKRVAGLTTSKYLQEIRLDEGRRLLEVGTYSSVQQVATVVGYEDSRSFSRRFKHRFGKLPSDVTIN